MDQPQKPAHYAHLSDLAWAEMELAYHSADASRLRGYAEKSDAKAKAFAALVRRFQTVERT